MFSPKLTQLLCVCLLILVGCAAPQNLLSQKTDVNRGGQTTSENTGGIGGTGIISDDGHSGASGIGGTGQVADRGIGGTGQIADRGIGGTGQIAGPDQRLENGIGGTGQQAHLDTNSSGNGSGSGSGGTGGIGGTGIVGTITGFGSIWVNNTHVTFDDSTPITINKQPATAGDFEIGQVVAVTSLRHQEEAIDTESWHSPQEVFFGEAPADQPNTTFKAKSIDVIYEVVGPVSQVLSTDHKLNVLNQNVFVTERTAILDRRTGKPLSLAELCIDDYIQVSGLRQADGGIVASRLDVVEASSQVELIGVLSQSEDGQWRINDQTVVIDAALLAMGSDHLNDRVLISGVMDDDQIVVESMDQDSIELVFEQVNELIYEGYLFEDDLDGAINVGGYEFSLPEVIDLGDGDWDDEPIRINAQQLDAGEYEAYDVWVDENEVYLDLLPDSDWDSLQDDQYFEDDVYDESFEDDYYDDGSSDDGYYDESFEEEYYEDEYYEEVYYEDEVYEEDVYQE
ncbi:hypothetical protein GCM10007876_38090 [Litoribrevibacter albus]|uniref:DUF5666 domain-containing protein n=2 Tax=Litoribrevibacter albus TaxID=1473156 RepID=A0AA37W9G0_9GAMM|nr:hypothetical protein GCM10007876_38090 [Litoribrevibacter albus]